MSEENPYQSGRMDALNDDVIIARLTNSLKVSQIIAGALVMGVVFILAIVLVIIRGDLAGLPNAGILTTIATGFGVLMIVNHMILPAIVVRPMIGKAIEQSSGPDARIDRLGDAFVQVWADVKKKHSSHAITADMDIGETAHAVEFMRGDAVIVTGAATGDAPKPGDVLAVRRKSRLPVYLGSGVTRENLEQFFAIADGFIIGSEFKQGGHWSHEVDRDRVKKFMAIHGKLN